MRKIAGLMLCLTALSACGGGSSSPTSPTNGRSTSSNDGSTSSNGGNSPAAPSPSSPQVVNAEVSGPIDSLAGSSSAFQFKIGSRVIRGGSSTTFDQGGNRAASFADLKNGVRVEVKGQQADGFVQATRIHLEDDDEVEPDDDDDEPPNNNPNDRNNPNAEVRVEARLTAFTGTRPNLMLTVGSTAVRTHASTRVTRRGVSLALDALAINQTLEVEGVRQADGSILASKISIEDDDEDEVNEIEVEGVVGALAGACPSLTFRVTSTPVATTAATRFDDVACSALKNNDKVRARGTKRSDGVLLATRVKRR
jgi:hypothetical protein